MKQGLTYLIFVIDRSGSMASIRKDMIGGFNSFIKTQRDAKLGDCRVFAYKFDTDYEPMFEDLAIENVGNLTEEQYVPRGGTALFDSLGKTIVDIGARLARLNEDERPEKVLVVTITDGEDNDHLRNIKEVIRYDSLAVASLVKTQTEVYNWSFAYIGANQDAWAVGRSMGYAKGTTLDYAANSKGVASAFQTLGAGTTMYRSAAASAKFCFAPGEDEDEDDANVNAAITTTTTTVTPVKGGKTPPKKVT